MLLVLDDKKRVGSWVGKKANSPGGYSGGYQAVGVKDKDNNLVGGMVFTQYTGYSVEIHLRVDSPRYVPINFYRYVFQYGYIWMGCERGWCEVAASNKRCHKLLEGMYFKREGVARKNLLLPSGDLVDSIIFSCLRQECKLIPEEYRYAGPIDRSCTWLDISARISGI